MVTSTYLKLPHLAATLWTCEVSGIGCRRPWCPKGGRWKDEALGLDGFGIHKLDEKLTLLQKTIHPYCVRYQDSSRFQSLKGLFAHTFQIIPTYPAKHNNNCPVHPHAKRHPQGASGCFWNDLQLVGVCNKITTNQIKQVTDTTASFASQHLETNPFSHNSSLVNHVFWHWATHDLTSLATSGDIPSDLIDLCILANKLEIAHHEETKKT